MRERENVLSIFKYLGSIVTNNFLLKIELSTHIGKASDIIHKLSK